MKGEAVEKIKGGKLVRIRVGYGEKIDDVKITGDFFLHPEETIKDIESSLKGISKESSQDDICARIKEVLDSKNASLIGVEEDDFARLIKEAMKQ